MYAYKKQTCFQKKQNSSIKKKLYVLFKSANSGKDFDAEVE